MVPTQGSTNQFCCRCMLARLERGPPEMVPPVVALTRDIRSCRRWSCWSGAPSADVCQVTVQSPESQSSSSSAILIHRDQEECSKVSPNPGGSSDLVCRRTTAWQRRTCMWHQVRKRSPKTTKGGPWRGRSPDHSPVQTLFPSDPRGAWQSSSRGRGSDLSSVSVSTSIERFDLLILVKLCSL